MSYRVHTLSSLLAIAALASAADAAPLDLGTSEDPESDVVGGTPVTQGEWPDVVALISEGQGVCSGTLIARDVVLTAGHCTQLPVTSVKVNALDSEGAGDDIQVEDTFTYPNWNGMYDVAVLVLASEAAAEPREVLPSCAAADLIDSAAIHLVGFGSTSTGGERNNTRLNEVEVSVEDSDCSGKTGCKDTISPDGEFAAGDGGIGSCHGDSGGPAYLETSYGTFLAGVVSRGYEDAPLECGYGGIYTRADAVLPWVREVTGKSIPDATCGGDDSGDDDDTGGDDDGGDDDGGGSDDLAGGCSAASAGATPSFALFLLGFALLARRRSRR